MSEETKLEFAPQPDENDDFLIAIHGQNRTDHCANQVVNENNTARQMTPGEDEAQHSAETRNSCSRLMEVCCSALTRKQAAENKRHSALQQQQTVPKSDEQRSTLTVEASAEAMHQSTSTEGQTTSDTAQQQPTIARGEEETHTSDVVIVRGSPADDTAVNQPADGLVDLTVISSQDYKNDE